MGKYVWMKYYWVLDMDERGMTNTNEWGKGGVTLSAIRVCQIQ